jgi:Ribonucleotide reductase, alpha subunit
MKVTIKNPRLKELLKKKKKDTDDVWKSIRDNDGSVQHLEFLTDEEKEIYRTFAEIDQSAIIEQAAVRQMYVDQGQSLNLMISPKTSAKDINQLYLQAWKQGIKTLYYQHSLNAAQQLSRDKICRACE